VAFVLLNLLSLSLVFGDPLVTLVGGAAVLGILAWHARPEKAASAADT
jgi:hypothetical protein